MAPRKLAVNCVAEIELPHKKPPKYGLGVDFHILKGKGSSTAYLFLSLQ